MGHNKACFLKYMKVVYGEELPFCVNGGILKDELFLPLCSAKAALQEVLLALLHKGLIVRDIMQKLRFGYNENKCIATELSGFAVRKGLLNPFNFSAEFWVFRKHQVSGVTLIFGKRSSKLVFSPCQYIEFTNKWVR